MVTATIKDFRIDARKIIWADVEYNIDGEIRVNPYPMQKSNIVGLTKEQVADWLRVNIIYQCDTYITAKFKSIEKSKTGYSADADYYKNDYHSKTYSDEIIKDADEETLIKDILMSLVDTNYSRDTAPLIFGTSRETGELDVMGEPITEFTLTNRIEIKADGTYIEKAI
jgi:hypothetical protein